MLLRPNPRSKNPKKNFGLSTTLCRLKREMPFTSATATNCDLNQTMIDQFLVTEIGDALATEFPAFYIGRQHTSDEMQLPAILLKVEAESVLGSPLYRGALEVAVVTASADTTTAQQALWAQEVDAVIRTLEISTAVVALYGVVPTTTQPSVNNNQFVTTLNYTVGFGPAA